MPWLGGQPRAGRRRPSRAVLRQFGAPLRDRAVGARLGRQPRAVHRPDRAHRAGRGRARAGSTTSGRPAAGSAPTRPSTSASPSTTGARAASSSPSAGASCSVSLCCVPAAREVSAQGDIAEMAGAMQARLDGKIGPMSADTFKALWPSVLAPKSREWVGRHLLRGSLQGGTFRVASGGGVSGTDWTPGATATRVAGDRRLRSRLQRARRLAGARSAARAGAPGGRQPGGHRARCRP